MTNEESIKTIMESESCFCKHGAFKDCNSRCKYRETLNTAIKALERMCYLTDRPCSACKFHSEDGCSRWECEFSEKEESANG